MMSTSHDSNAPEVIPHPFRGDTFLLRTVQQLMRAGQISTFVETGAFYGITTAAMAQRYPQVRCYSCEINPAHYHHAAARVAGLANVTLTEEDASALLARLAPEARTVPTLFWLDAHGYGFPWPLRKEIRIIAEQWEHAWVLIDDFLVPDRPWFGYDEYDGQVCSYAYIRDQLGTRPHRLWYPTYQPPVEWPLRGWCVLALGDLEWTPDPWLEQAEEAGE
ncbi:MAG: hypothetical protein OHK0022_50210 [Roseiflexaceae bacterium]